MVRFYRVRPNDVDLKQALIERLNLCGIYLKRKIIRLVFC